MICLLSIFLAYSITNKNRSTDNLGKQKSVQEIIRDIKATNWDNYVPLIIEDDYKKIDTNAALIDTNGRSVRLSELTNGKYHLVVRYSFTDCNACVDTVINIINELKSRFSSAPVLAITDSNSDRDFIVRSKSQQTPLKVYSLINSSLGLYMENKNFPFVFVITPEYRATKIFMPTKEISMQIREYMVTTLKFLTDQTR